MPKRIQSIHIVTIFILIITAVIGSLYVMGLDKNGNDKLSQTKKPTNIAIITFLAPNHGQEHFQSSTYNNITRYSLPNMLSYTHRQGYPLFFYNSNLVNKSRSTYWSKMPIIRHYLETDHYEWILFTDVDVLFVNESIPLSLFTDMAGSGHHVIGTLECGHEKNMSESKIRSGFFMVRNSDEGKRFLNEWEGMYDDYKEKFNPEQEALETLHGSGEWKEKILILNERDFHTYSSCYKSGDRPFSVHFPGAEKKKMKEWVEGMMAGSLRERDSENVIWEIGGN